jgi:hypothetical protein
MTPQKRAAIVAAELGMDFTKTLLEHLDESSYIYSSPECFILAVDAVREFGEDCQEEAIFVTLAVGNMHEFLEIDPRKETRKWLGFCRENGGDVHWLPYQDLRKLNAAIKQFQFVEKMQDIYAENPIIAL